MVKFNFNKLNAWLVTAQFSNISYNATRKKLLDSLKSCVSSSPNDKFTIPTELFASLTSILMGKNADINNDARLNYAHIMVDIENEIILFIEQTRSQPGTPLPVKKEKEDEYKYGHFAYPNVQIPAQHEIKLGSRIDNDHMGESVLSD